MSELYEKHVQYSSANVVVPTTTETVALASDNVVVPVQTCAVHVRAWGQMTSGVAATGITARLRRGNAVTGALVGEANVATLAAAAGGNEQVVIEAVEQRSNVSGVGYCLTVQQAAASADGTFLQGLMEVEILSG